jgi:hypothetical protein
MPLAPPDLPTPQQEAVHQKVLIREVDFFYGAFHMQHRRLARMFFWHPRLQFGGAIGADPA